jgi:hypothetical protein
MDLFMEFANGILALLNIFLKQRLQVGICTCRKCFLITGNAVIIYLDQIVDRRYVWLLMNRNSRGNGIGNDPDQILTSFTSSVPSVNASILTKVTLAICSIAS